MRSFREIAATLDPRGELEGLPFMPEMLAFCGKRSEVWNADKTCGESSGGSIRRVRNVVHLKELRCGGEAHGGCETSDRFHPPRPHGDGKVLGPSSPGLPGAY